MLIRIEIADDNGQAIARHFFHCIGNAPHEQSFASQSAPVVIHGWDYFGFVFYFIANNRTIPKLGDMP